MLTRGLVMDAGWELLWPNAQFWAVPPPAPDLIWFNTIYDVLLGIWSVIGATWVVVAWRATSPPRDRARPAVFFLAQGPGGRRSVSGRSGIDGRRRTMSRAVITGAHDCDALARLLHGRHGGRGGFNATAWIGLGALVLGVEHAASAMPRRRVRDGPRMLGDGWPALFESAFRQSRNAMVLLDERRRVVDANAAMVGLLGHSRAWLVRRPMAEIVAGGPLVTEPEWQQWLAAGRFAGEATMLHADGHAVTVQWGATTEIVTGRRLVLVVALHTSRCGSALPPHAG